MAWGTFYVYDYVGSKLVTQLVIWDFDLVIRTFPKIHHDVAISHPRQHRFKKGGMVVPVRGCIIHKEVESVSMRVSSPMTRPPCSNCSNQLFDPHFYLSLSHTLPLFRFQVQTKSNASKIFFLFSHFAGCIFWILPCIC